MNQAPEQPRADGAPPLEPDGIAPARVGELLSLLGKGVRAHQMYQPNNPVYQRFVEGLRTAFDHFWEHTPALRVVVEETGFRYGDQLFAVGEGRDSLAFLFYKDGIRYLTFHAGFEEELDRFLDVLHHGRLLGMGEDDLVTLLWEQEFQSFEYGYVDLLAEGLEIPESPDLGIAPLPTGIVAAELGGSPGSATAPGAAATPSAPAPTVAVEDFQDTLYFLDPAELDALREELDREWEGDAKADVLSALFDRLEDVDAEQQSEILSILRQLLPVYVARGDLASAATILRELAGMLDRATTIGEAARREVDRLFDELSSPVVLGQLVQALEDGGIQPNSGELALFLAHLRPVALPALVRAAELASSPAVRVRLQAAIDGLAGQHPTHVIELLRSDDHVVATGAARLAGRVRLTDAGPHVARILDRPDPATRLAAVEALVAIRSATAVGALQTVLDDPVREVRIAAARGLGAMRYQPAHQRFEELIEGRVLRSADVTEKLAFFEAFALVGGAAAVPLLERLLNARGLLGRRQPPEIRACAATALGRISSPAARTALEEAREETDPVVRSAVLRAIRQEAAAS